MFNDVCAYYIQCFPAIECPRISADSWWREAHHMLFQTDHCWQAKKKKKCCHAYFIIIKFVFHLGALLLKCSIAQ